MNTVTIHFVKKGNAKLGGIPSTNSSSNTCPDSCPLKAKGCYARAGFHTRMNWAKVDAGERGGSVSELCKNIKALKPATLWRHNVVGDLPHTASNGRIHKGAVAAIVAANEGRKGYTYTHHNMAIRHNREVVANANANGFTVNLSADNLREADELADLGIAPVATVLPSTASGKMTTPKGRPVVICPATRDDINVTCKACGICAKANRKSIVGFPAHGNEKKAVDAVTLA